MENKQTISLTEGELRKIISESVSRILTEVGTGNMQTQQQGTQGNIQQNGTFEQQLTNYLVSMSRFLMGLDKKIDGLTNGVRAVYDLLSYNRR